MLCKLPEMKKTPFLSITDQVVDRAASRWVEDQKKNNKKWTTRESTAKAEDQRNKLKEIVHGQILGSTGSGCKKADVGLLNSFQKWSLFAERARSRRRNATDADGKER